eukprot:scaffold84411_cov31-Tisochrysis_lutea.AAC.2
MGVDNLAIVFAPTLLPWDSKATPTEQLQRAKDGVALVQALLRGQVVIADTEAEKYDTSVVEEESVLDADEEKTLVVNNLPTPDPEEETAFVAKDSRLLREDRRTAACSLQMLQSPRLLPDYPFSHPIAWRATHPNASKA